jgi:tetratricopeptide (TPR) repeat protein
MSKRKKFPDKRVPETQAETTLKWAWRWGLPAGIAAIAVAAAVAYLPSISGEFILDDDRLVYDNDLIKSSDGLYQHWCTAKAYDYWPATNTSLWIEWRLWGMHPSGYHVTNLILHIIEALLIWLILRKLSIPGAFLAALIFALHPVNVESVAWISQRKNTMAMLFFLLSIWCYLKAESQPPPPQNRKFLRGVDYWYGISLVLFILTMLSKGSAAVLPVLLLGIIWWLRPLTWRDFARIAPFFAVAAVFTEVNVWFQTHGEEIVIRSADFAERLLGAGGVVWFYLYKALLPFDLAFIYPQWQIQTGNLAWWLPLLAALAVTAALWHYRKKWGRPFLFAWGFFCFALLPVMGFTDVGFMRYSLVADHYQHVAIIGVIALAAAGLSIWQRRVQGGLRRASMGVAIGIVGILAILTWRQNGIYRDPVTLYENTIYKNPGCWLAQYNLAKTLMDKGLVMEATNHFRQAVVLKSDYFDADTYFDAHINLGVALTKLNRFQEGIEEFEQALKIDPNSEKAYDDLGVTFFHLGRNGDAIKNYEKALKKDPSDAEAHNNLAVSFIQDGRFSEAVEHLKRAMEIRPGYISAQNNLAEAYAGLHQSSDAIVAARKAIQLARSQGNSALAQQIEDWLKRYRAGLEEGENGKDERTRGKEEK